MDKEDIEMAMDIYYEVMGWDKKTGAPSAVTYHKFGLGKAAEELSKRGLLP
jgi:aldehyde:ferredoxin oxidoreductase